VYGDSRADAKLALKEWQQHFLPYLAGAADERQYRVMTEREQWFRVVMGQDEFARLITRDSDTVAPLPGSIADELSFNLEL